MIDTGLKDVETLDRFHMWWYEQAKSGGTWAATKYHGVKIWKCPLDMWTYQELIYEVKPSLIIETGTAFGGSALFFAHCFDVLSQGHVYTVDIQPMQGTYPRHPRITYWSGRSSTDPAVVSQIAANVEGYYRDGPVMVVLDSDHSKRHVLDELRAYAPLVTAASYLVVEDTNINGHPVFPEFGPGPQEAIEAWLPNHPDYQADEGKSQRFGFSFNAWLRRKRA